MASTPYIRPLQVQGGTFYTFSSAAEDLAFTFNQTTNKFRFSKFALLNLPNFSTPKYGENTIQFDSIDTTFLDVASQSFDIINPNNLSPNLETSFQNYCLNLESTILSSPDYNPALKINIAERVFWKWLKEMGGIRFRSANSNEVVSTLDQTKTSIVNGFPYSDMRWTEEDSNSSGNGTPNPWYSRVVQYIGECDIVNSVQNQNNCYSEVYIHVPTKDGNTPLVLFKTTADQNYYPGNILTNSPANPIDSEYINGRSVSDGVYGPNTLTKLAIFDQQTIGTPTVSSVSASGITTNANWYEPRNIPNSYYTDNSFFDGTTDTITKTYETFNLTYKRSRLDGIQIDFNPNNYLPIVNNTSISTIEEFNSTSDASSFEFNTILLYYDVYDPNNPSDSETNLYGILFLEDIQPITNSAGQIPPFAKYIPDNITKLNGNSYGLKINLKFDTDVDNTGVELAINDYSSFSLSMFMDAVNVLQDASGVLNDQSTQFVSLANRVASLEDVVVTMDRNTSLNTRISALENAMTINQSLFTNTQDILGLIERNYNIMNTILSGSTNITMSYNLDLLKSGKGILIDRSVQNKLIVNNINQNFNLSPLYPYNFTINPTSGNILNLSTFSTYYKHKNFGLSITLTNDLVLKINDIDNQWQLGQTFRLVFDDPIILNGNNILIYTDAKGLYPLASPSGTSYSILVGGFTDAIFAKANNTPIFDIICVDAVNLSFEIDQIR